MSALGGDLPWSPLSRFVAWPSLHAVTHTRASGFARRAMDGRVAVEYTQA